MTAEEKPDVIGNDAASSQDGSSQTLPDIEPATDAGVEDINASKERDAALEKVVSRRSEIDPAAEPPDGGLNAWLKVFGCFLIYSNVWGFTLTFGAFQTYYQHHILDGNSASAISWIGTVQSWLLIIIGVLSGPLFDLGWFRPMLVVGNVLIVFGIFMTSLCRTYWQVFLAQAVCVGVGAGLLYVPSLALIGLSFKRKRSVAQGITTSGIAVGGVAYIIAFDRITVRDGFGWGVRTMGFIALGITIIAFPMLVWGTSALAKARTARKLLDLSAFRDPGFLIFSTCSFTTFFGYLIPYFYIPTYAQDALGLSESFSLYILVMSIAASFFGRLFIGFLAMYLGSIFTWFLVAIISGIISLSWIAVDSQAGLITFAVFWGFCSGGLVTSPAAVFPRLCPDLKRLGTRTGMSWGISSFASLTGGPIAGALLKNGGRSRSDYLGPQLWCGCCLLAGSCVIALLWVTTMKRQKTDWRI